MSFNAAYGNERVPALVYLPKRSKPPFQTVVYFPPSSALSQRSSTQINPRLFDWVIKSGRALVFPIYKSTYERGDEVTSDYPQPTNTFRDHVIAWTKDLRRTIDYLETRQNVDRSRLAFVGTSWGAAMAPVFLAVEPRFPMFQLLGVSDADKRRVVYNTGHNIPRPELIRESLQWLDKYLGLPQ